MICVENANWFLKLCQPSLPYHLKELLLTVSALRFIRYGVHPSMKDWQFDQNRNTKDVVFV